VLVGVVDRRAVGGRPAVEEVSEPESLAGHRRRDGVVPSPALPVRQLRVELPERLAFPDPDTVVGHRDALDLDQERVGDGLALAVRHADVLRPGFAGGERRRIVRGDEVAGSVVGEEVELGELLLVPGHGRGVGHPADGDDHGDREHDVQRRGPPRLRFGQRRPHRHGPGPERDREPLLGGERSAAADGDAERDERDGGERHDRVRLAETDGDAQGAADQRREDHAREQSERDAGGAAGGVPPTRGRAVFFATRGRAILFAAPDPATGKQRRDERVSRDEDDEREPQDGPERRSLEEREERRRDRRQRQRAGDDEVGVAARPCPVCLGRSRCGHQDPTGR